MGINLEILPPASRRLRLSAPHKMRHWISGYAQYAAALLHVTTGNWIIHLVDDQRMIQYHHQTMNLATTTDVLTFDYTATDRKGAPLDLETIICVDEAERQAKIRNHLRPELEILLYAIHSLLHCIGYDDRSDHQAGIMHRKEDLILQRMDLPPVYHAAPAAIKKWRSRCSIGSVDGKKGLPPVPDSLGRQTTLPRHRNGGCR
ncbi:MAG: rRNA maturation RNase YbeY [Phycisphaerae bacterium]